MPETPAKPTRAARRRLGPGDEDEAFLSRWSRRKEAVRAGEEVEELEELEEPGEENLPVAPAEHANEAEDEEIDLDALPDIETLGKDSDFTLFMQKGIPDALRNKALRKLWLSDPVLANVDGLVDYGEDFTGDGLAGKAFKTAWKIGQGYLTDDELADMRATVDGPDEPEEPEEPEELEELEELESLPDEQPETEVAADPSAGNEAADEELSPGDNPEVTVKS